MVINKCFHLLSLKSLATGLLTIFSKLTSQAKAPDTLLRKNQSKFISTFTAYSSTLIGSFMPYGLIINTDGV